MKIRNAEILKPLDRSLNDNCQTIQRRISICGRRRNVSNAYTSREFIVGLSSHPRNLSLSPSPSLFCTRRHGWYRFPTNVVYFVTECPHRYIFYPPVRELLITGSRESTVNADVYWRRPPFVETAWGAVRPTCPMNLRAACTSRFMSQLRASINCILSRFDFLLPATPMYSRIIQP